ncbi:MAG: hypothetical protein HYS22_02760 [Deltaproteobacteria bacterium]|nr:hypothetical protein [Deltaproteobacteria bacterium]
MPYRFPLSLLFFLLVIPGFLKADELALPQGRQKQLEDWKIITASRYHEESGGFEAKAEGLIPADPEQVWLLVTDFNHWKDIFPHVMVSQEVSPPVLDQIRQTLKTGPLPDEVLEAWRSRLEKIKEGSWWVGGAPLGGTPFWEGYLFEIYDFPWPVTNRWAVNRLVMDETGVMMRQYQLHWTMLIGTFKQSEGYFKIGPYGKNSRLTDFVVYMKNDPGLRVPKTLLKMGSHLSLPNVVRGVRNEVSRQKRHLWVEHPLKKR